MKTAVDALTAIGRGPVQMFYRGRNLGRSASPALRSLNMEARGRSIVPHEAQAYVAVQITYSQAQRIMRIWGEIVDDVQPEVPYRVSLMGRQFTFATTDDNPVYLRFFCALPEIADLGNKQFRLVVNLLPVLCPATAGRNVPTLGRIKRLFREPKRA